MTYTISGDTSLGEVLGLQFAGQQGIATRQNGDGSWELVSWPTGLGSPPTQQQVTTWAAGIDALRVTAARGKVKSQLRDNDPDRVLLRAVVKVLMNSLIEARAAISDLRAAMVNASSLADLKARATAVSALANRNWQQAMAAADQVIDAGQAEE